PYSCYAMRAVADSLSQQPEEYEKLMLQAAALNPAYFYNLGNYFANRGEEDKAAKYYERGSDADPDSVRIARFALWRSRYYLKKGDLQKAREIADFGAEVYSYTGLQAKGEFLEATTNYDGAFTWYKRIEERYNDSLPLIGF